MIDYEKFQKSLNHLALQFENYQGMGQQNLPRLTQEAIAESVIQRFETCYDCMWKVLRRYLIEELGLPDVPNSPKPVIRLAHENDLLTSVEPWLAYADARTGTAHDYSGAKAKEALSLMGDFIRDAIRLYERMSGERWRP